MTDNGLGEYLRANREALLPVDVELSDDHRHRRVKGLRREEVALLAGISPDYYLRLEQGRERHPSEQVLTSIARALRLGPASEEFLQRLVRPVLHREYSSWTNALATDRLAAFVAAITTPAYAHDRMLEVIVANPLARALSPSFTPGVNLIRAAFLDPDLRSLYRNWEEMTRRLVSYLRVQAAAPPDDPRLPDLLAELTSRSPRFAELWARHDVGALSTGVNLLQHPVVGELEVNFERLCLAGTDDPVIVIYHAAPGPASASALEALAAITAPVAPG